jgi:hypothetical protein
MPRFSSILVQKLGQLQPAPSLIDAHMCASTGIPKMPFARSAALRIHGFSMSTTVRRLL